jgi:D-methionine transport system substrate-binding protein
MGIYSSKIKSLGEIKPGSVVPIPNDPTNGGRALKLLEQAGLIKLKDGVGYEAMAVDIVSNPKNLVIQEMEAAQITRALQDVDFAVVNTNYAIGAGLVPTKDALVLESSDSPYVNLIVVRTEDKDKPFVKEFVSAYQSDEIKTFINDHFKGSVVVGW